MTCYIYFTTIFKNKTEKHIFINHQKKNVHTVKSTNVKCYVRSVFIYVYIRIPTFQDTEHSYHLNSPFVSFPKSLSRNHFFWTSYRWNHTICIFFWFISLNIMFFDSTSCCMYQYLSFVWVISHFMHISSKFIELLFWQWIFEHFQGF